MTKDIFNKWRKQLITKIQETNKNKDQRQKTTFELNPTIKKQVQIKNLKKLDENLVSKIKLTNLIEEYNKLPTAKVIQIKQLRSQTYFHYGDSKRSTLHIRLQKSSQIQLTPGCVINIYPQNTPNSLQIQSHLKSSQNSYLIKQIIKRVKLNQPVTRDLINIVFNEQQNFTHLSKQQKLLKYKQCLINKNLTVQTLINQYKPKNLNFYAKLQLEPPRPYSLCSWNNNQKCIELCVSTIPNGVTSKYFKQNPGYLKFNILSSSFKTPLLYEPIMMICNGTGIAPFRSIAQFYADKNICFNETPLKLYYGIQNQNSDFYFGQEWMNYQKKGLVDVKLAESRRNPEEKEYVQDIIDCNIIYEQLMIKKGLIYICGGSGMAEGVKQVILKAIRMDTKNQEQVNNLYQDLKARSIIISEIFH